MSSLERWMEQAAEIKRSGRPQDEVLDALILAPEANPIEVIAVMMYAYDLGLGDAKILVGNRCHMLKNRDDIAASEAWVIAKVDWLIRNVHPAADDDWLGDLLDEPTSGRTPWEPTGIVERIEVVERFLGVSFHEANEVVTKRLQKRRTSAAERMDPKLKGSFS